MCSSAQNEARTLVSGRKPTHRERQILQLLAEGNTRKEAADRLGISKSTVRNHMYLMRHFYAATDTELMAIAVKLGWISIEVEVA